MEYDTFPDNLKTSTVTPIPKISNAKHISDFRPINTLPCLEKVLERAVYKQVVEFFLKQQTIFGKSVGF